MKIYSYNRIPADSLERRGGGPIFTKIKGTFAERNVAFSFLLKKYTQN